jgi:transcriptional regulator with XRE-family HTH domain
MTSLPIRFGRACRAMRERAGISQERFATLAKIDRTYYSKIERGRANVSLEVIGRIAKGLDVEFGELFRAVDRE